MNNLHVKDGYCPSCGQYPAIPDPVNLSNTNKQELVNIVRFFEKKYEETRSGNFRKKIHAMQKVLFKLGIWSNTQSDKGEVAE